MSHSRIELRAEGLLIKKGRFLLVQHVREGESYWVLPGGHVERGESLDEAVVREFMEELNLDVIADDLLWMHQFIRPDRHTVNFTFAVSCPDLKALRLNPGKRLRDCRWFTPEEVRTVDLRPPLAQQCQDVLQGRSTGTVQIYRF